MRAEEGAKLREKGKGERAVTPEAEGKKKGHYW
jgi:hypothetical protein